MPRSVPTLDDLIVAFDKGLRTVFAPAHSSRAMPGADLPHSELSPAERAHAAALMRVNHTGEICAQALYQGQALTARNPDARASLERAAQEETEHLAWTGRRIESLLWRDDIDTARRYIDLYDRFGCSSEHLKLAFRCIIQQGPIDPKAADKLASRVHNCWIAPEEATTASSQATTGATTKDGTIPN